MQVSRPIEESWSQFRRRMPRDAIMLLEGMEQNAARSRAVEAPSNMLLEVEGDRARAQIAAKRVQRGEHRHQMLPSFEMGLSGRNDSMIMPGRIMSVGDRAGWSPHGMSEDVEPQLLTEG